MNASTKRRIFQIMYLVNIPGAGISGFLLLFLPTIGEKYILWEGQDWAVMTILGAIWFGIGVSSIFGFFYPYRFLGIFVVQFIYKTLWLVVYWLPNLLNGTTTPPALNFIVGIFVLLIMEVALFVRPADFRKG